MKTIIANVCAVCRFSPFTGIKAKTRYCKKADALILQISSCEKFKRDPKKYDKRIGGLRTAKTIHERKQLK